MKKLTIVKQDVLNMDISMLKNSQSPWKEWNIVPGEHQRLCAYVSTKFDGVTLIDAGTSYGNSAIAMSYNLKNTVRTYDIADNDFDSFKERGNIIPVRKDINTEDKDILLSSPLIMLDIDPHDGQQELVFVNLLKEIGYEGFVLCDDIHLNANMQFWWDSLDLITYDVTEIGHHHGTGLICFGNVEAEII
jgi:hypothetical protein